MKKLLYFGALWCGPCNTLSPTIKKVSEDLNIKLEKINIDNDAELAAQFNVRSIPTVILFEDGKPVDQFVGAKGERAIREFLKRD